MHSTVFAVQYAKTKTESFALIELILLPTPPVKCCSDPSYAQLICIAYKSTEDQLIFASFFGEKTNGSTPANLFQL